MKPKSKKSPRYQVYTRPELYEAERSGVTWLVRISIVLTMVAMLVVLRRPVFAALTSAFPSWQR